jgi:hypothetical protein
MAMIADKPSNTTDDRQRTESYLGSMLREMHAYRHAHNQFGAFSCAAGSGKYTTDPFGAFPRPDQFKVSAPAYSLMATDLNRGDTVDLGGLRSRLE